jgi:hypothetical protein
MTSVFNTRSGSGADIAARGGTTMRIYIFKSESKPDLRAFGGDLVGSRLPSQFKPWRATGSIGPDKELPYNLSRDAIETAINDSGFQLWRMKKKSK